MPFVYKIDVLKELKDRGLNTNKIRMMKLLSQSALTDIRNGKVKSISTLETLCKLLSMDVGDIITYEDDDSPME